jgi:hypothetical protein
VKYEVRSFICDAVLYTLKAAESHRQPVSSARHLNITLTFTWCRRKLNRHSGTLRCS